MTIGDTNIKRGSQREFHKPADRGSSSDSSHKGALLIQFSSSIVSCRKTDNQPFLQNCRKGKRIILNSYFHAKAKNVHIQELFALFPDN